MLAAALSQSTYWYLTRSTGAVALILLTLALVLGIVEVKRYSSPRWPRFVIDSLHRNASLLAMSFLVVHILTAVLDSFAPVHLTDSVVPFAGSYRPLWLGFGAIAFDLLIAVVVTSLLRVRIGFARWRAVHWLVYASWPVALLHSLGTGSDVRQGWLQVIGALCVLAVIAAVLLRVLSGWQSGQNERRLALGGLGGFALFLLLWVPQGPLAADWARRAGTPATLLPHTRASAHGASR